MSCYVYSPVDGLEAMDTVSDLGAIPSIALGSDFSVFIGGVLRPEAANWIGEISTPRAYFGSFLVSKEIIRKLALLGELQVVFKDALSVSVSNARKRERERDKERDIIFIIFWKNLFICLIPCYFSSANSLDRCADRFASPRSDISPV